MDAAELDRRARTSDGWIPTWIVSLLVEHGHVDEVRRQAEDGDWFCARKVAELLDEDEALGVLRPFVDSGWWDAARTVALLLEERGRPEEALALVRTRMDGREWRAVPLLAELLARQGRIDEVIALLGPRTANQSYAQALVELTEGHRRDDEVAGLLPPVEAGCQCPAFWGDAWNATELTARVLERQGRVDEAVALLRPAVTCCGGKYVNVVEQLADVLARHGRETELREFIAGDGGDDAAHRLAKWLAEQGRVDEAVGVLRPFVDEGSPNAAWETAELLRRNGRIDEAIEVLRPEPGCGDDWIVHGLGNLLAGQGRADEALAVIDAIAEANGGMPAEFFPQRVGLLVRSGRQEQALAELRAHPDADNSYVAGELTKILIGLGRLDEAAEFLESGPLTGGHVTDLAHVRILQGCVEEAVTLLTGRATVPVVRGHTPTDPDDPWSAGPPF